VSDRKGALETFTLHQVSLSKLVSGGLQDGTYTGEPFADAVSGILGATAQIAKRNKLLQFAVIPQR
jgi:hypothetical protein